MSLAQALFDNFNDNSVNASLWIPYTGGGNVVETNGALTITPAANTFNFNGYRSVSTYDLTGSYVYVEIPQGIGTSMGCQQYLDLTLDANNKISISFENTSLMSRVTTAGVNSDSFVSRMDSTMRWWRIRENGGSIYFDTSSDGITWTNQRTTATTFAVTSLVVGLGSGTWQGVANPGAAKFDNFNVFNPKASTFVDDFRDGLMDSRWIYSNSAAQAIEQNGQLSITPTSNQTGYYGYISNSKYDLTSSSATVGLVQGVAGTSGCEQQLSIEKDSSNGCTLMIAGTTMVLRLRTNGSNNEVQVGRVDANNRWWRIREDSGTVYWETSPDGLTWNQRRAATPSFSLTSVEIRIVAGTWKAVASPGVGIFDNVNTYNTSPGGWFAG